MPYNFNQQPEPRVPNELESQIMAGQRLVAEENGQMAPIQQQAPGQVAAAEPAPQAAPPVTTSIFAERLKSATPKDLAGAQSVIRGMAAQAAQGKSVQDVNEAVIHDPHEANLPKDPQEADKWGSIGQALLAVVPSLLSYAAGGSEAAAITSRVSGEQMEKEQARQAAHGEKQEERKLKEKEFALKSEEFKDKAKDRLLQLRLKEAEIKGNLAAKMIDKNVSDSKNQFDQATTLRHDFLNSPLTKQTQEIATQYGKIQRVAAEPSPAGDLSMIFSYMKMLDPASTVREGEQASAQNAAGVPTQVSNMYNQLLKGERLAPEQRNDFLNQAGNLYQAQLQTHESFKQKIADIGAKYGIPAEEISPNFGQETSSSLAIQQAKYKPGQKTAPGQVSASQAKGYERMSNAELAAELKRRGINAK